MEPVAWAVLDGPDVMHTCKDYGEAESCSEGIGGEIVPLYRSSALTDAERSALVAVLNRLCTQMTAEERQTLVGLIERTTEK